MLRYVVPHANLCLTVICVKVTADVRKEKLQLQFDKRMTGSTAIDEVLQEVLFIIIRLPIWWRFGAVGSDVGLINEVTLRRARLVLGWVTVSGFNSRCGKFISV